MARALKSVDRAIVPDLPDRVIAATALVFGHPILTKDSRLRAVPGIQTAWSSVRRRSSVFPVGTSFLIS